MALTTPASATILYIEDEHSILEAMTLFLETVGYQVIGRWARRTGWVD